MRRYKTAVTDYEGMQGVLDGHAEQGWTLFSVSPDTWRRTFSEDSGMEKSPFEELDDSSRAMREYSASYYLLVFQREDRLETREAYAEAEEPMAMGTVPRGQMAGFEE